MGTMRFLLPNDLSAESARELQRACLIGGPDNMPWPSRVEISDGRLTLEREIQESGTLVLPWRIEPGGRIIAGSGTLMERPLPYALPLELARGKVHQLRNQLWEWQANGMRVPEATCEQVRAACRTFGTATTEASEPSSKSAQRALDLSCEAANALVRAYVGQVFEIRHQADSKLETVLGCRLEAVPDPGWSNAVREACNRILVPIRWNKVEPHEGRFDWSLVDGLLEWAENEAISVNAGPVIDFASVSLPDWLSVYAGEASVLIRYMARFVQQAVNRYRSRIRRWTITGTSNHASVLSLREDELLWLTIKLAQIARQTDPDLELLLGVSQPWGERMAREDRTHSPFVFADTLLRSDLNLAGLEIEVIMGILPRGSYCRDPLETSRLLDLYALLGIPLTIVLGYPSSEACDDLADPEQESIGGSWDGSLSQEGQDRWLKAFLPLVLCKPYVQAVHWVHASDSQPHLFPHCGLVDTAGRPKPALAEMQAMRSTHLF